MNTILSSLTYSIALVLLLIHAPPTVAQCIEMHRGFGVPGPPGEVTALQVFSDGANQTLIVAGYFTSVEGVRANHIAQWNGSTWSALGRGLGAPGSYPWVDSMAIFNDGSGDALYVAGQFTAAGGVPVSNIARWNGTEWSALGSGIDGPVQALASFDDGTGPALYAAGQFTVAGGAVVANIARWDGSNWLPVGDLSKGPVAALAVYDDGHGPALYAGCQGVLRWDGVQWSAIGPDSYETPSAMTVFDDGTGPALYVGSYICGGVCRWDGAAWSAVGTNAPYGITSFAAVEDASGTSLYAAAQGYPHLSRWDGIDWTSVDMGDWYTEWINALAVYDDGSGPSLYAGSLQSGYDTLPLSLARKQGSSWVPVGNALGTTDGISTLAVANDGSGPALFAGGYFLAAGGIAAKHIAKFDGARWTPLGDGVGDTQQFHGQRVNAITALVGGPGSGIYAAGQFNLAGNAPANNIARWDGSTWMPLDSGLDGPVAATCVFDDGSGEALYASGSFSTAGGIPVPGIARWDGSYWSAVGSGMGGGAKALIVFDQGTGNALYAGGAGVSRWDGSTWTAVGDSASFSVETLAVLDDGTGPALCAAGSIMDANYNQRVMKWDGSSWLQIGDPPIYGAPAEVTSLRTFDDGYGPALYAAVLYYDSRYLVKSYGSSWSFVAYPPGGDYDRINSMAVFQGPSSSFPTLYLAFEEPSWSVSNPNSGLAAYSGCDYPIHPFCFGDGTVALCPCGNTGLPGHGCDNSAGTGGAILSATGRARLSTDSLSLTSAGERSNALSFFWQSWTEIGPRVFGDGVGCLGLPYGRLYSHAAIGGSVTVPQAGDLPLSARSAALGSPLVPGSIRVYQVFYRDPDPSFCPWPLGDAFNVSNALRVPWGS